MRWAMPSAGGSMLRRASGGAASACAIDEKAKGDVQCVIKYDTLISTNENNTHSLTPQKVLVVLFML